MHTLDFSLWWNPSPSWTPGFIPSHAPFILIPHVSCLVSPQIWVTVTSHKLCMSYHASGTDSRNSCHRGQSLFHIITLEVQLPHRHWKVVPPPTIKCFLLTHSVSPTDFTKHRSLEHLGSSIPPPCLKI